jgi:excisionase family DNA binding protein
MTGSMTYTVEEAARLLGVSRGVGYEAARRGELPTIRLGRRLVVPKIALERMLGLENDEGRPDGNGTPSENSPRTGRHDAAYP